MSLPWGLRTKNTIEMSETGSSKHIIYADEDLKSAITFDARAFEFFFKEHFVEFCSFCSSKFGFDTDLAKEVVQSAFIKLWEARQTIYNTSSIKSYMFKTISNNSLDIIRHEKTKQKYSTFFVETNSKLFDESTLNNTNFKQLSADVANAVAELPEQMRAIFSLSRDEGLKYKAIAQLLNISVKTVETQISRALSKLRQQLGHYLVVLVIIFFSCKP